MQKWYNKTTSSQRIFMLICSIILLFLGGIISDNAASINHNNVGTIYTEIIPLVIGVMPIAILIYLHLGSRKDEDK
jgi:hypothetical protein